MACGCLYIEWTATSTQTTSGSVNAQPSGTYNFNSYYEFVADGNTYFLWYEPNVGGSPFFYIGATLGGTGVLAFYSGFPSQNACPLGSSWISTKFNYAMVTAECGDVPCVPIEDRHSRQYDSVQLPITFQEQDRGFKICCDPLMVLASGTSDTWQNDVSSAWIKVSDPSDTFSFLLEKDGIPVTSYALTVEEFPNEENAYYTTVQWKDVLALEGAGCYELKITYNISGVAGDFTWAKYTLMPYSIQNALKTARIRVKFNLKQEIEGINFTDANVEDSFRFWGFIGNRQTNTEIDNLTYQNRTVKTVVRENLDSFIISTDPLQECFITPLTDLYLLSENEMWISDYNAHNHSYNILDIPVVVEESPEIDYLDKYQRRAVLTCQVGLRNKTRRTHY